MKSLKCKKKKLALTSLPQWTYVIRQFMEIYLYGPIKILQLHTPGRIQNF